MNIEQIVTQFGVRATPEQLPGGSQLTFRVGNVVLKRVKETSPENNHSPELIQWIATFSHTLDDWETCSEKKAAELVIQYTQQKN